MHMHYDDAFVAYFQGRIRQVFLYVTDRCGLRCEQCLYKTTLANREMDHATAIELLADFRAMGAEKLTFIGGEPTLYGVRAGGEPLLDLIDFARQLGYRYLRLDTNGQQHTWLYTQPRFRLLDNLAFSLDGPDAATNDAVRGTRTFERCTAAIRKAVELGYYTTITSCVHRGLVERLSEMVEFAAELGVAELNFHPLFKMGIDRDGFSGETDIDPRAWMEAYELLATLPYAGIEIRAPQRFVETERYLEAPGEYAYCPTLLGERVLIHPDGTLRICALCIGSPLAIGRYEGRKVWFTGHEGELYPARLQRKPCLSQVRDFGDLTPLCISYKPGQNEYVWRTTEVDARLFGGRQSIVRSPRRRSIKRNG